MSKNLLLFIVFAAILLLLNLVGCSILAQDDSTNNTAANNISPDKPAANNTVPNNVSPDVPESEKTPSKIIFILDASGSMWGKVRNEAKIVSAKRVLKKAIGDLPDDSQVGLIAYGHRSKSDCADIETISELKPIDKTGLSTKIDALDAKGKTPITDSLRKAIAEIKALNLDETVKIVLVSDGLETCDGDPCKLVKEAKEAGVKITVHVIGFDTGKLNVSQFECIAQAGGGLYLNADDADGLGAALDQAVSAEVSEYNNFISVKALSDGKLSDATITVRNSETGEVIDGSRTYEADSTNPRKIPLPVGTYEVIVQSVKINGTPKITFEKVEVKKNETTEKVADFSNGKLIVKVTLNGKPQDATVTVLSEETKKIVTGGRSYPTKPLDVRVIPGRYYFEVSPVGVVGFDKFVVKDVVVKSGDQETLVEKDFEAGTLKIGTKKGAELIDSTVNIIDVQTGKVITGSRTYTSPSTNPREFTIAPGTYRVEVRGKAGFGPKEITVTIKKGEIVEQIIEY